MYVVKMQTYVRCRKNKIWITYGWHIKYRKAIELHVGGRSSDDIKNVVASVLNTNPSRINTDNYQVYSSLIENKIHRKGRRKANHIEREHRNMRKDISCLIRETMCFSKKKEMLEARIRWYFWSETNPYFFLY